MTDRKDFEKWICGYVKQEHKNLNKFMYKLLTVKAAWQEIKAGKR